MSTYIFSNHKLPPLFFCFCGVSTPVSFHILSVFCSSALIYVIHNHKLVQIHNLSKMTSLCTTFLKLQDENLCSCSVTENRCEKERVGSH